MRCEQCDLPDNYHGQGDGIGSCDCSRCECCGAAPFDCECGMDWDPYWEDTPEGEIDDYLCNDTACPWRLARVERKRAAAALEVTDA